MVIITARRTADDRNRLAPRVRSIQSDVRHIDDIRILRINGDAAEVPGTTGETRVRVFERPGCAAVIRTVEASLFCLDERVHAFAVWRDIDANASPIAVG